MGVTLTWGRPFYGPVRPAGVIIGGWDPKDGGQVYTVTLGGTLQRQKFSIGGELPFDLAEFFLNVSPA